MKHAKKFEVIECKGTSYEIGIQWGQGCKENILKAMEMSFGGLCYVHKTTKEEIISNAMKFLPKAETFDPELIDMLKGQAVGAGISFEEIFALKCGFDLGAYYNKLSGLCTSFAVTGRATVTGKTLLGQNIDWFPGTPMDLIKIVYPDGRTQLSLVLWGIVEYTLSSKDFGMCANGTWANIENCFLNIPIGCYLPKAMRQNSLNEALAILRATARGLGYYHLASDDKQIIGIESIQDDYQIIEPEQDLLVHSNHYLTDRFKPVDMVNLLVPDSIDRLERIKMLINDYYGRITPEIMMGILADHDNEPNAICRHIDETKPPMFHSETLASFIMIPEDQVMLIAYGNPCESEYVVYHL